MDEVPQREEAAFDEAANWHILLREEPENADLRDHFTLWLQAVSENSQAWLAMGYTVAAIERTPPELREQVRKHATPRRDARWKRSPRPSVKHNMRRIVLAAAIAACLVIVVAPSLWLRANADNLTGTGEVQIIRLPDGSKAILGPDSAIQFNFVDGHRDVGLLSGQAFFEVRHDPAHPFEVKARDVRTIVLGTAFDVRLLGDGTRVGVDHGSVRVQSKAGKVDLAAGEWAQVDGNAVMTSGQQASDLVGSWQAGKAFIRNRTIAEVIDEIRPWQKGQILLLDKRLGSQTVTGIYDVSDPASALRLLVNPYAGRVVQVTPWLLIVTS